MSTVKKGKLTKKMLDETTKRIQDVYLSDSRPWVIGYSGGKDSSCVVQLVWNALLKLDKVQRNKPVYVITSDTLVETPAIEDHLTSSIDQISKRAKEQDLPIQAHTVKPKINDTFWVNLLGKGYPAPYSNFRWCTDRLKIQPTTVFIQNTVAKYGEVVILLGARKAESNTRAQVMDRRTLVGESLSRHNDLPNAFVFTPVEDWDAEDVWTYLLNSKSPWGFNNRELVTMYRNAQSGECPLVIDKSTPSCGGGRFGCWTCTVVARDRSMENMIDNGEEWMRPLLEFRDFLTATQEPATKKEYREHRRRSGRVEFFESDGKTKLRWGPYKLEWRYKFLRMLLEAQVKIQEDGPNPEALLIQPEELHKIRQIWMHEEGVWDDPLPRIYEDATGQKLEWVDDDFSGMGGAEQQLITEIANEFDVPGGLITGLFDVERKHDGMTRRSGIYQEIGKVLRKDWRSRDEVLAELESMQKSENE
jgi:DNA sulfur modification protein DndC